MLALAMKLSSVRSPGIFMVSLSAVLLIAAVVSMFYYIRLEHRAETGFTERGFPFGESSASRAHHPDGHTAGEIPSFYPPQLVFPFRWLTLPLTMVGIVFLLVGLFFCRHELFSMF